MGQLILAAAVGTAIVADTPTTVKATASEPGIADLGRLVAQLTNDAAEGAYSGRLINSGLFTNIKVKSGKVTLTDGSGTGEMPLPIFDALRGQEIPIGLGFHKLSAGEWVEMAIAAYGVACNGGYAVPFTPSSGRARVQRPQGPSNAAQFVPSGTVDKDATTGTLTFTATEEGILDLGSLALGAAPNVAADNLDFGSGLDQVFVTSYALPSGDDLVIGSGTAPGCPATAFAGGRQFDWFRLGCIPVGSGASVTVTITNHGNRTVMPSGIAAWWPGAKPVRCAC